MTVTDVHKDPTNCSMKVASEWEAPIARVWQLWADPRKLERWWGPPTYPATFVDHDFRPGGQVSYFMTGPDGEEFHGWWTVVSIDEPNHIELEDGFGESAENRNDSMPITKMNVKFTQLPSGSTRMVIESQFPSREAMEKLIEMGMEEGLVSAIGQIEGILAEE